MRQFNVVVLGGARLYCCVSVHLANCRVAGGVGKSALTGINPNNVVPVGTQVARFQSVSFGTCLSKTTTPR